MSLSSWSLALILTTRLRKRTEPGLVALYDIQPENGVVLFLQSQSHYSNGRQIGSYEMGERQWDNPEIQSWTGHSTFPEALLFLMSCRHIMSHKVPRHSQTYTISIMSYNVDAGQWWSQDAVSETDTLAEVSRHETSQDISELVETIQDWDIVKMFETWDTAETQVSRHETSQNNLILT